MRDHTDDPTPEELEAGTRETEDITSLVNNNKKRIILSRDRKAKRKAAKASRKRNR
jgi:hypothetical protein